MKKLIAGNWKMNGLREQLGELDALREAAPRLSAGVDLLICPPVTLLSQALERAGEQIAIGAQDCHHADSGAHTGEIAAPMLRDIGASHVILGHSERRADNGETSQIVRGKTEAAWRAGLVAIVCVGETDGEREAGTTLDVLKEQLAGSLPEGTTAQNTVVAYEPVWAIGTGKTPTTDDVAEVHAFVRAELVTRFGKGAAGALPILYGGSVKPGNARELMAVPEVGGALVGGASLKAADFIAICEGAIGA